jgi:hypothetical protein
MANYQRKPELQTTYTFIEVQTFVSKNLLMADLVAMPFKSKLYILTDTFSGIAIFKFDGYRPSQFRSKRIFNFKENLFKLLV